MIIIKNQMVEAMNGFDLLPDSLILLIFNSISDIKTLICCRSVSKRFNSLVPQTESLSLKVDCVISPESDSGSLFTLLKSLLKSIHDLLKPDTKPTTRNQTQNSPARILNQFDRIRDLQIELPAGDLKLEKGAVIKWRAEFGKSLKSCVVLGFRRVANSEGNNAEVDIDFAGGLKTRVVWTISALIAASARHYLLNDVVKEHREMERLVLVDREGEGTVAMEKEGLRECREESGVAARGVDWQEEGKRTVVPSVRMRMRHEQRVQLKDGVWVEGVTLVVVRPCNGGGDVEDAELALGAFGGGIYGEAVQISFVDCGITRKKGVQVELRNRIAEYDELSNKNGLTQKELAKVKRSTKGKMSVDKEMMDSLKKGKSILLKKVEVEKEKNRLAQLEFYCPT